MRVRDLIRTCNRNAVEAELLLAHIMNRDRSWIIAHNEEILPMESVRAFRSLLTRRRMGEPIAYLTGFCEFYGRTFTVDRRVLIPRPSTEGLVDLTLDVLANSRQELRSIDADIVAMSRIFRQKQNVTTVLDVGTGSGCIAITLACERPYLRIIATDIDERSLEVATENARRHNVSDRVTFLRGTIPEIAIPFLLVSNPPYIPEGAALPPECSFEPKDALFAKADGMAVLCQIYEEAERHPFCHGIVLECMHSQAHMLCSVHAGSATVTRPSRSSDRCTVGR